MTFVWSGRIALVALVAIGAFAAGGCKQGEGDRCQVDEDCRGFEDGTLVCRSPDKVDRICTMDSLCQCLPPAIGTDAANTDAANTDAANTDAAGTDAAGTDAANTDAVPGTDTGTDAVPGTDAGTDAAVCDAAGGPMC